MENLAEAIKIGGAIALFVMALTLSISSFSQANTAVKAIVEARDRETSYEYAKINSEAGYEQYVYVEPTADLTRKVGIEAVVTTVNRVLDEDIEIHFLKNDGTELYLYYADEARTQPKNYINPTEIYSLDGFGYTEDARRFIKVLLGGYNIDPQNCGINLSTAEWDAVKAKYINKLYNASGYGIYEQYKDRTFVEKLGEYYTGSGTTETKKVVITYILQ